MQKKREKSVKARGGIERGSATAANRARKLRIESELKQKARRANLRIRKSVRAKSSAREFADPASGAAGARSVNLARKSIYKFCVQTILNLTSKF